MNLRLNKIETDLSRKLQEETRDSKVHRKKLRRTDNEVKKPYVESNKRDVEDNKKRRKRFLTIDGEILGVKKIDIEAEFPEMIEGQPSRGIFLDTTK